MLERRISFLANSLVSPLRSLVFPPICPACGDHVDGSREWCCPECLSGIRRVHRGDELFKEAFSCLSAGGLIQDLETGWYFEKEGVLRTLIHGLKYRGMSWIGEALGRELGMVLRGSSPPQPSVLLPVPLHPSKQRERGYNQSAAIARGIASVTGREVDERMLRRVRWTPSQTTLNVEDRRENVRGAFAIRGGRMNEVSGKRFTLVDDILTTGATLRSCAETLRAAGASGIHCCTLALPL